MKSNYKSVSKNIYTEFPPPDPVKDISVKGFTFTCIPDKGRNVIFCLTPSYTTEIIFLKLSPSNKPGIFIKGPNTTPLAINAFHKTKIVSIKFKPLVLQAILGFKTSVTVNELVRFESFFSKTDIIPIKTLLSKQKNSYMQVVLNVIARKAINYKVDSEIKKCIDLILNSEGNIKLNELHSLIRMNKRTFQRKFKELTGLTAKDFCKIVRFESVSKKLVKNRHDNFDVIFESGFYDQAHFSKEFKQLAGLPPSEYQVRQKTISFKNLV